MTYEDLQKLFIDLSEIERQAKIKEVAILYSKALKDIKAKVSDSYARVLANVDKKSYYNEMIKFDRLKKLEASILETYKPYANSIGKTIEASSVQSLSNIYYRDQYAMNWVAPYTYSPLPIDAIELSVYRNKDAVIKAITDKQKALIPKTPNTLTNLIAKNKVAEISKIFNTLDQGLLTGRSYSAMAKDLTKTFKGNLSNATRVIVTEGHRNQESGSFVQWTKAQEKGVEGYRQIVSVKDSKTRTQSGTVDSRKDTGEGFLYPDGNRYFVVGNTGISAWDINDRETTISIIDGVEPLLERGRNPVTGKNEVISASSFDDWAKSKGLYRDRNEILRQGKVKIKKA